MTKLLVSLFFSVAFAATGSKDWKLVQETDAVLQVPVCRAYTQVASNLPVAVELSLSFPTAFDRAPMMILKVPANSGITRAVVPLTTREQEDFLVFQAAADAAGQDMLWYVPIQMEKLTDIIVGNNFLPLKFTKDGKEANGRISLNGSAATMNQVAACLKASDYIPRKFFKELNTAAGSATLGADQTIRQLMKYVDDAFGHFQAMAKADADLLKLRNANKTLLQQEADALKALNTAQGNLDRAQSIADTIQLKITTGEERLRLIPGELASLQAQKPNAEALYNQKKAAFDPLRQRAQELQADINASQRRINDAESNINSAESTISNGQSKIRSLEREADDHMRVIRDVDQELPSLQRRENDLQSQLNSYSVENEKQKILNRDGTYQSLRNERPSVESSLRQKQGDLQRAQQFLRHAEEALRRCLANPAPAPDRDRPGRPRPHPGQPEEPGRPHPNPDPNPNPNPNPTPTPKDCSREEAQVNRAQAEVSRLSSEVSNLQSRLQQIDSQMNNIENRAERDAQSGRDQIANELRRVSGELGELRSKREVSSNRLRDIQGFEIPRYQREINDAQNDLPGYRRELADAQRDFNAAVSALRSYKASVNFDAIQKEYVDAKTVFDGIVNGITDRQNEEKRITQELPGLRNQLANQQKEVARLTLVRDAAQNKLAGIQAQLTAFREQEKVLLDLLATLKPQYDELRKLYQTLATVLLTP